MGCGASLESEKSNEKISTNKDKNDIELQENINENNENHNNENNDEENNDEENNEEENEINESIIQLKLLESTSLIVKVAITLLSHV